MVAVADPAASPPSKETLVETCFWQHATEHPERLAVVDHDGTEVGFGALLEASNQVVHGLRDLIVEVLLLTARLGHHCRRLGLGCAR